MEVLVSQILVAVDFTPKGILSNVERTIRKIREQCGKATRLVLLPELSTIDYSESSFRNLSVVSRELSGEIFEKYASLAKQISSYIAYGIPVFKAGQWFISHIVIDDYGRYLTQYDKIHVAQFGSSMEKKYFSRGNKICVFEIDGIRFGMMICYDMRFPAYASVLKNRHGVDVFLHPCAFTRDTTFFSWHSFVITRALENLVYFLSVNRAGEEWGKSIVCPPWINEGVQPLVLGSGEDFMPVRVEKKMLKNRRKEFPFERDALADYGVLDLAKVSLKEQS